MGSGHPPSRLENQNINPKLHRIHHYVGLEEFCANAIITIRSYTDANIPYVLPVI